MTLRRSISGLSPLALALGLTLPVALFGAPAALAQDTTPPSLVKVEVRGTTLTYTFNEPLDPAYVPDPSSFRVNVFGNPYRGSFDLPASTLLAIDGSTITATLDEPVTEGQAVNARYWWRGRGSKLRDLRTLP